MQMYKYMKFNYTLLFQVMKRITIKLTHQFKIMTLNCINNCVSIVAKNYLIFIHDVAVVDKSIRISG